MAETGGAWGTPHHSSSANMIPPAYECTTNSAEPQFTLNSDLMNYLCHYGSPVAQPYHVLLTTGAVQPPLDTDESRRLIREALDEDVGPYRIDPGSIKTPAGAPEAKGGQGVVSMGTVTAIGGSSECIMAVAVKKYVWERDDREKSLKFFKSYAYEIELMARMSHPNIVKLVGFVEDIPKGEAWMILPWEVNGNLKEFLKSGEWEIPERISLINDVVEGVEYLHTQSPPICHGDLKSLNILVTPSCHAVITDFGSARVRKSVVVENKALELQQTLKTIGADDGDASPRVVFDPSVMELTLTGPKGTLRWTAPEVLDESEPDLPSDIWALGWICWEGITGRLPFDHLRLERQVVVHVTMGRLPAIREDAQLSHIVMLCSVMSDCWLADPSKRIKASMLKKKLSRIPSVPPSGGYSDGQRTRSCRLSFELGSLAYYSGDLLAAERHYQSAFDLAKLPLGGNTPELSAAPKNPGVEPDLRPKSPEPNTRSPKPRDDRHTNRTSDDIRIGNALYGLGRTYIMQSKFQEALRALTEAIEIHSRIGNEPGVACALVSLSHVHYALAKHEEALDAAGKAHEFFSRHGNDESALGALLKMGEVYQTWSRVPEAERIFKQALEVSSRIDDDGGKAEALLGLGETYRARFQYEEAEKVLNESRELWLRIGIEGNAAKPLISLGHIYLIRDRYEEAEKAFCEASDFLSRTGDSLGASTALLGLARSHYLRGNCEEAEKIYLAVRKIQSETPANSPLTIASALLGLGRTYAMQRRHTEAELCFTQARDMYFEIENDVGAANALQGMGDIYCLRSRYPEAEASCLQAYEMQTRLGNGVGAGQALRSLGRIYVARAQLKEAETALLDARKAALSVRHDSGVADASAALADMYLSQSRYHEAEERAKEAYELDCRIHKTQRARNTLFTLANIYGKQGKHQETESILLQALKADERADNSEGKADILLNLADAYKAQKKYSEAEDTLVEALGVSISISWEVGQVTAATQLAVLFRLLSKKDEEIEALIQAEAVLSLTGYDIWQHAEVLDRMGQLYELRDEDAQAEECFRLAQAIYLSVDDVAHEGRELINLGNLYGKSGQLAIAEEHFAQARVSLAHVANDWGEAAALEGLLLTSFKQGKLNELRMYCEDAREIYNRMGREISINCAGMLRLLDQPDQISSVIWVKNY